ncbi:MAG TPA: hypothetical protein VJ917_09240 [Saprospiraceae bacterium]|nr:hypothetical protein [Saprospiraceae bacterium]
MDALIRDIKQLNLTGLLVMAMLLTGLISLLFIMNARIETNDPLGYYAQTVALDERFSVDLSEEAKQIDQFGWTHNLRRDERTHKIYSQYPIGVSLMQWPFFYLGRTLSGAENQNLWKGGTVWWVCAGSAFYGLTGLVFLFLLGAQVWDLRLSALATSVIFFGTALYYYLFFQPGMSHSYAFFSSSAFLFFWLRPLILNNRFDWSRAADRSLVRSFALGLLLGLSFIVRYLDGLLSLLLVLECFHRLFSDRTHFYQIFKSIFPGYLLSFAGFFLVVGLQFWIQYLKHGTLTILSHYDGSFEQDYSFWKCLEVLFSNHHGLFYWHPLLILGLIGFAWSIFFGEKDWKVFGIWSLVLLLIQAVVVAAWGRFAFGANSFGHRFFISLYPLFFVFIGYVISCLRNYFNPRQRTGLLLFAFFLLLLNASAMLQFATGVIPPDAPVSWEEMLRNTWTELPEELNRRLFP